jgi:hypothetical protein
MCFKLGRKKGSENEVMGQFRHITPEGFQNRSGPGSGMGVSPVDHAQDARATVKPRCHVDRRACGSGSVTHSLNLNVIASTFFALCAHCGQDARAPRG